MTERSFYGSLHLNYPVFLQLVDLPSQAASRQSVVNDELIGLEAGLFKELWTCKIKDLLLESLSQKGLFMAQ